MNAPRLLICGFGAFDAAPRNPAQAVVERLAAQGWRPAGVQTDFLVLPVAWGRAPGLVLDRLRAHPCDGVLLTGVAVEAQGFRVERLGRNAASQDRCDADGAVWRSPAIVDGGPAEIVATAPGEAMLVALRRAGLPADQSEDAGDYLCNFSFYSLLAADHGAAVGFLHLPQARECAAGAAFGLAQLEAGVCAAATAFSEALKGRGDRRRTV